MKKISFNRDQILAVIRELAYSNGSWGRLYEDFMEMREYDPDRYEETMTFLESQHLGSMYEVAMMFS